MAEPVITDKDVIDLVRKEFERKIANYCKKHGIEKIDDADEDVVIDPDDDDPLGKRKPPTGQRSDNLDVRSLIRSIGLRVSHKDSGLEYYIRGVNTATGIVSLETPEGNLFQVDFDEIEEDYRLG